MKIDDLEFAEVRKTLQIAADCSDAERGPRLQARIDGERRSALLNDIVADLMPCIHIDIPLPVSDWRELEGFSFTDESHKDTQWQFGAWCILLQYADVERHSFRFMKRDDHEFLIETDAAVTMHDLGDDPYTAHFYALTPVTFGGVRIRVPKSSGSPTGDAETYLKTFHDCSSLARPCVSGLYWDPKNPNRGAYTTPPEGELLCYEVLFRPL